MKKDRPERIIKKIVKRFKERRLSQGLSHEVLAEKSGVTRPAVSHIESGRRKPSLLMSLKLAEALNERLSDIVHDAENSETP